MKQDIHGVVLLDKPEGMSSNRALQQVKRLYEAKKAGHTGALDPIATGLLPLCFGQATKASSWCLGSDKQYETLIRLGETTDTYDREGELVLRRAVNVSDEALQAALDQFRGEIKQVPPMYSALKKDGQPLYKLARQGKTLDLQARERTVYALEAERMDSEHVVLRVHCSSGFYIRSLAYDLGEALGCGAHVRELRRTAIKSLSVDQAISLQSFAESSAEELEGYLQPIDVLLGHLPKAALNKQQVEDLSCGRVVIDNTLEPLQECRFYTDEDALFAVGDIASDGKVTTRKIFVNALN